MRALGWVVVAALLAGAGWWWFTQEAPRREAAARKQAQAAMARNEAANSLYRWRDENGVLQVSERPPPHGRYERIDRAPRDGIEVRADRGD